MIKQVHSYLLYIQTKIFSSSGVHFGDVHFPTASLSEVSFVCVGTEIPLTCELFVNLIIKNVNGIYGMRSKLIAFIC